MTEAAANSPYTVPGQELDPNQPLWRWDDDNLTEHERFFIDVGGHSTAFSSFGSQVQEPARLCRAGGVVVVDGPSLSGKTSLINRCIQSIRQGVPERERAHVHIFDFAGVQAPGPSVEERTAYVAELIRIKMLPLYKPEWLKSQLDGEKQPNIKTLLMLLQTMLQNDDAKRSFLIVPPPLEFGSAAQEIDLYRSSVGHGIVCLLEQVTGGSVQAPAVPGRNPPIRLTLRNLQPGEASRLVETWPDTSTANPPILQGVMAKFEGIFVVGDNIDLSIGMLLATLREVYRRRRDGTSKYGQVDSIELDELVWAWRQVVISQSIGQGNLRS